MTEVPTIRVGAPIPPRESFLPVVGVDPALCDRFIRSAMAGRNGPLGEILLEGWPLQLKRMSDAPADDPSWEPRMSVADGVILLAQYLDPLSLDDLNTRRQRIRNDEALPLIVLFCRSEGAGEFKIGCPVCRQKMWVQDAEIGKRGRCAHCNALMDIVSPADLLRRELRLPDRVPILSVDPSDAGLCRGAVSNLLARKGYGMKPGAGISPADFLKKSTVPILARDSEAV